MQVKDIQARMEAGTYPVTDMKDQRRILQLIVTCQQVLEAASSPMDTDDGKLGAAGWIMATCTELIMLLDEPVRRELMATVARKTLMEIAPALEQLNNEIKDAEQELESLKNEGLQ